VSLTCLSTNCAALDGILRSDFLLSIQSFYTHTYLTNIDGVADLMASAVSRKELLDVVRHNDDTELSCYFPQWANLAKSVREKYETFVTKVEKVLLDSVQLSSKDFASITP
jgi:hypothetical protein